MAAIEHRFIETRGVRLHLAAAGEGPLVLLLHGFPETWYSWRHQLAALAEAGYRAVAPDLRGFGQSARPEDVEAYAMPHLVADAVGIVEALGEEKAVVVGHDWGAQLAWYSALLRPDLFRAAALLSVPFRPLSLEGPPPFEAMRRLAGERQFYVLEFQEVGEAEDHLEADVRTTLLKFFAGASGDAPPGERLAFFYDPPKRFLDTIETPRRLPPWLGESDLEVFTAAFEETGFRGGLGWYRNYDHNHELLSFLSGAKLRQPTLFIGGEEDEVMTLTRPIYDALETNAPDLWRKVLLPGVGHWTQQENPAKVNALLLEFLEHLETIQY